MFLYGDHSSRFLCCVQHGGFVQRLYCMYARDSALDFYLANGFTVSGAGFRTTDTDLPHHRIVHRL